MFPCAGRLSQIAKGVSTVFCTLSHKKLFCIVGTIFDRIEAERQPLFSLFFTFFCLGGLIAFSQGNESRIWAMIRVPQARPTTKDSLTTDFTDVTDGKAVFFIREIREIRGHIPFLRVAWQAANYCSTMTFNDSSVGRVARAMAAAVWRSGKVCVIMPRMSRRREKTRRATSFCRL